ncbi:MAG: 4Fe-4S binding protein [Desulfovibrionales bacterium]|nr:4Fe-4S binding protein [Desulfovibrionales bacterium]
MSKPAVKSVDVTACRGVQGVNCRFTMDCSSEFPARIMDAVTQTGWDTFLRTQISGQLLHHHTFKIAIAGCPNGCSRPHIADIGIIRAKQPVLRSNQCSHCGLCGRICPDKAISYEHGEPRFDLDACMACGMCIAKCPEQAIGTRADGYRVVLGGKLGRHPRLASEVDGVFCEEQVLAIVTECLLYYMEQYRPKVRFGTIVEDHFPALMERIALARTVTCP